MKEKYDVIVVGAGIAGLGVAAILAKEARQHVLVLDRFPTPGGRLSCFADYPGHGWTVDTGLHFIELGPLSSSHELNRRAGKEVSWASLSQTVEFWNGNRFQNLADLVPMNREDKTAFKSLLQTIASMSDTQIEAWDNRSLEEWLSENVSQKPLKELITDIGMIMTTIPAAIDMAAGEVLYIARDNLRKAKQLLAASYPLAGMQGLTSGLEEVIRECGSEIKVACEVQEILIKNGRALGVRVPIGSHPYQAEYCMPETRAVYADRVVCALPIYQLGKVIDFSTKRSPLPHWWVKRIQDIQNEITGLVGYMIGLKEPVVPTDKLCFFTALQTNHAKLPFQAFPASNYSPGVAPQGKQLWHTDIVCEHAEASDKFKRERLLKLMWEDIKEMFPGIEDKLEWRIPYYVDGCDGLARKPGLVGNFKPGLRAPGVTNLFFAGDTYVGRGLAANGAAKSAMLCADLILSTLTQST
ncbi:phytoene desaturase family protein [Desulfomonile tiedjei]|uniref:Flavin containing amine oxidoreductase n=1 Tax=Desulfomonile tiedjei (strain ATCC 49306 / DSM 6799 / DCB-1) TaxID=706587 RepID=I4CEL4_DESTA|nr:FAD-dependent oxidoreductase [Desulfomonile tiedjei]AFM28005.1 Flavin containing amine oxidoreductase [Desulfomonile tiedjei DSM 6799]